nr:hypothetical protein CFP56_47988 [Quercus suber]
MRILTTCLSNVRQPQRRALIGLFNQLLDEFILGREVNSVTIYTVLSPFMTAILYWFCKRQEHIKLNGTDLFRD